MYWLITYSIIRVVSSGIVYCVIAGSIVIVWLFVLPYIELCWYCDLLYYCHYLYIYVDCVVGGR